MPQDLPPVSETTAPAVHRIDGPLTIYTVGVEHRRLLAWFASPEVDTVELSGVTECDGAGLQLLCALVASARAEHRPVRLLAPSPAISMANSLAHVALPLQPLPA